MLTATSASCSRIAAVSSAMRKSTTATSMHESTESHPNARTLIKPASRENAEPPFGSSAILGSFVACEAGVAEESEDPWLCVPGFGRVCLCRLVRDPGISCSRELVAPAPRPQSALVTRGPQEKDRPNGYLAQSVSRFAPPKA